MRERTMGNFVPASRDTFNPEYGEVKWKRRLNQRLEEQNVELEPIDYVEDGKPPMQVTQENTVIYINQIADELDCIAVKYDADESDMWTWYFREKFKGDGMFEHVVRVVGAWATLMNTMYPMEHVVTFYEKFHESEIPDELPDDFS